MKHRQCGFLGTKLQACVLLNLNYKQTLFLFLLQQEIQVLSFLASAPGALDFDLGGESKSEKFYLEEVQYLSRMRLIP